MIFDLINVVMGLKCGCINMQSFRNLTLTLVSYVKKLSLLPVSIGLAFLHLYLCVCDSR